MHRLIAALMLMATPVSAEQALADLSQEARDYVEGNIIGVLYHEMGHALIDLLDLPVLGQEEDAADMLAVVLAHELWQEDYARRVTASTALSYQIAADAGEDVPFWDVHGSNEQRFYNTICLFYGADPEGRADFAQSFDLPEDRAETCAEEFALASASWGGFLDEIALAEDQEVSTALSFVDDGGDPDAAILLQDEVTDLNSYYALPEAIEVRLEPCDEANAFYFSETRSITICTEYVDYLIDQAATADM